MRIVAVADTHLYQAELEVPAGDVFVHAGDMCRRGDLDELATAVGWIRSLPHRHKVIVAGNHDWAFLEAREAALELVADGLVYLEDAGCTIEGVSFWGSPWQPAYNDWAFNLPRGEALAARWALVPPGVDVLVTHGPPLGIGDASERSERVGGRHGCADLRERVAVVRPLVHVFGHIHHDGGVWERDGTLFGNVTTWECERQPTVIDVDVAARRATARVVPPHGRRSGH